MKHKQKITGIIAIILLSLILLSSIFASQLAPFDPNEQHIADRLQSPSTIYPLGTDLLGRDMLSRILHGGKTSILIALLATLCSMVIGTTIGLLSGYFGGFLDIILTSITNIFQALPETCFMIAIAGILGPSIKNLILALSITSWAGFARIIRTEVLSLKEEPYIEGMRCLGCNHFQIILKHILPNMLPNVIILFTTRIGRAILSIAALSFLGLGVQPPMPDWSVMINDARLFYRSAPHLIIVPGIFIFITLFAINLLGDYLRDIFDVKNEEMV